MDLHILGTSSMVPTKERNHPGFFISYKGCGFLFDCGEGTQRQLRKAEIKATKITHIFITHWHGDHVLGLPGLLDTLSQSDYSGELKIYGPVGIAKQISLVEKAFPSQKNIVYKVVEVEKGIIIDEKDFSVSVLGVSHGIPCIAYRFDEKDRRRIDLKKAKKLGLSEGPLLGDLQKGKGVSFEGKKIKPEDVTYVVEGKSFAYITDSKYLKSMGAFVNGVDLLLCEATYLSSLEDQASKYKHMSAKQAGSIAKEAKAGQLVLTHISGRHAYMKEVLLDAKKTFKNVAIANDLEKITF